MQTRSSLQRRSTSESSDRVVVNLKPRSWGDEIHEQPQTVQPKTSGFNLRDVDWFSHDPGPRPTPSVLRRIQAKLKVGAPNDQYEQEADRVAEQVMSTPDSATHQAIQREDATEESAVQTKPIAATITPIVQRDMAPEEEEPKPVQARLIQREAALEEEEEPIQAKLIQREAALEEEEEPIQAKLIQREAALEEEEEPEPVQAKPELQRKAASTDTQAQPKLEQQLDSSKGGGSPLPADVRAFMEPRFGADFSQVRVHTGNESVQMNQDLNAQAFTHKQDVYFGSGKAPAKDALTAHELTHVVQQSGVVNQKPMQIAKTTLVQRDKASDKQTSDKLKDLEIRTKVLEKKTAANQLDLKYRALFGAKVSGYKQVVYRLTAGFQEALNGYQSVQAKQAASDAVMAAIIDQLLATVLLVAGAAVLEPLLTAGLGKLKPKLTDANEEVKRIKAIKEKVEKVENPINVAASGAANTATAQQAGSRAANTPQAAPGVAGVEGAGKGGSDPFILLASNMEALEGHTHDLEASFSNRATQYETMTPEAWDKWDKGAQEADYAKILAGLDTVALADITKVKDPKPLATTLELVLWAAWVRTFLPGIKPLVVKALQAQRLKELGVEGQADVIFDTTWVLWDSHKSSGKKRFDTAMYEWSRKLPQPLTK